MKMNNKKGFTIIETLIVSVFVASTLILLYSQVSRIEDSYGTSFTYNTTEALYNAKRINHFIVTEKYDYVISALESSDRGYINITDCGGTAYGDEEYAKVDYCNVLYSKLGVKQMLLLSSDITAVKTNLYKYGNEDKIDESLINFIKTFKTGNEGTYLAIEYNNNTYGSILLSQYDEKVNNTVSNEVAYFNTRIMSAMNISQFDNNLSNSSSNIDYRYTGKDVNNYVEFNSENWRIIGIIDGKIKLVREEFLGPKKFDDDNNNDWSNSSLSSYLNETYYNTLSSTAKDMIDTNAYYNLGGFDSSSISIDSIYDFETDSGSRVNNIKVGLMNVSDYGYSMSSSCNKTPREYNTTSDCKDNGTWLYENKFQWLMTPFTGTTSHVAGINIEGYIDGYAANMDIFEVRPVVFLKDNVKIDSGNGTVSEPFKISL